METKSPFLDYLSEFVRRNGRTFYDAAAITGISQPTFSKVIKGTHQPSENFINAIINKLCKPEEVDEFIIEYLNHCLYSLDPSLYGKAGLGDDDTLQFTDRRPALAQLFNILESYNKQNPIATEQLASGIIDIINGISTSNFTPTATARERSRFYSEMRGDRQVAEDRPDTPGKSS